MSKSVYESLKVFLLDRMSMSHVYQPVMLSHLLNRNGESSKEDIAKEFLIRDQSQIDYYKLITSNMPGKVLRRHDVVEYDKTNQSFKLIGFNELSDDEIKDLISICEKKNKDFIESRNVNPWSHRDTTDRTISGSVRYNVLVRAKGRCEACGVSSDVRAIEIDHIVPKAKGGSNDESNLQALCYKCNAQKRDRDDTDYHAVKESYLDREPSCIFCQFQEDDSDRKVIAENELANAIYDGYAVTSLHTLIIPKRHVADMFELHQPEINAMYQLLNMQRNEILKADSSVTGFNVGFNVGESAGQTVFHVHMHLIPRRAGDVGEPKGGVRGVIPDKKKY